MLSLVARIVVSFGVICATLAEDYVGGMSMENNDFLEDSYFANDFWGVAGINEFEPIEQFGDEIGHDVVDAMMSNMERIFDIFDTESTVAASEAVELQLQADELDDDAQSNVNKRTSGMKLRDRIAKTFEMIKRNNEFKLNISNYEPVMSYVVQDDECLLTISSIIHGDSSVTDMYSIGRYIVVKLQEQSNLVVDQADVAGKVEVAVTKTFEIPDECGEATDGSRATVDANKNILVALPLKTIGIDDSQEQADELHSDEQHLEDVEDDQMAEEDEQADKSEQESSILTDMLSSDPRVVEQTHTNDMHGSSASEESYHKIDIVDFNEF